MKEERKKERRKRKKEKKKEKKKERKKERKKDGENNKKTKQNQGIKTLKYQRNLFTFLFKRGTTEFLSNL